MLVKRSRTVFKGRERRRQELNLRRWLLNPRHGLLNLRRNLINLRRGWLFFAVFAYLDRKIKRVHKKNRPVLYKNVRETWGRTKVPHVPSALCTSAFERGYVSMWGTFSNSSILSVRFIDYSQLLHLRLAFSPTHPNSKSDGHGLRVRSLRTQSLLLTEKQQNVESDW